MVNNFKKTKVKLDVLIDINKWLTIAKDSKRRTCYSISRYEKTNSKYMEDYDKNKESSHIQYWNVNIYMVGQCHKTFQ